jgi:hypothetical protein
MPLNEHLIDLTAKSLIACRECRAIADVSIIDSHVKLIWPNCHGTPGSWATKSEAVADITAFVTNGTAGK